MPLKPSNSLVRAKTWPCWLKLGMVRPNHFTKGSAEASVRLIKVKQQLTDFTIFHFFSFSGFTGQTANPDYHDVMIT